MSFDPQAEGLYAEYKVGADTVRKKLGNDIVYLGRGTSIDVRSMLPNYASLTANNFIVVQDTAITPSQKQKDIYNSPSSFTLTGIIYAIHYDPSTGILNGLYCSAHGGGSRVDHTAICFFYYIADGLPTPT